MVGIVDSLLSLHCGGFSLKVTVVMPFWKKDKYISFKRYLFCILKARWCYVIVGFFRGDLSSAKGK